MTKRPIIFKTEMVKAILEGRKTMTRRVVKPQFKRILFTENRNVLNMVNGKVERLIRCPYGRVGDKLWVRETFALHPKAKELGHPIVFYKARADLLLKNNKWKPSIHMFRWASRITLEITNIRVERLQEISVYDCMKEGVIEMYDQRFSHVTIKSWFQRLWDSLNTKRGYSWESNPWVWVIEFKSVRMR